MCEPIVCDALPAVDGATATYSDGFSYPTNATYTCDATGGPPADGNATLVCQTDGSWSGTAPTCDPLAAIAEHLIGTWSLGGPVDGKRIYGIPIDGASSVANTKAACGEAGLDWVTQHSSYTLPSSDRSESLYSGTAWWGTAGGACAGAGTSAQPGISGAFCGSCHENNHNNPLCLNLATIVSDTWGSGDACINPPGGGYCMDDGRAGMKALCVER
eukprot:COSAG04_NODE_787_length_10305_cov_16.992553_13_plen_216_part_00